MNGLNVFTIWCIAIIIGLLYKSFLVVHISLVYFIKVPTFPSGGGGRKKGLEAISLCTKRETVCFVPPASNIMVVQLH